MSDTSSNAAELAAQIVASAEAAPGRALAITRHYGQLLHRRVRAKASGRPGPRVQTGDYRRSIGLQVALVGEGARATVVTNRPQANRLEYGFVGIDSLGRTYDQPPFPHFAPALAEVGPEYEQAILDAGFDLGLG